MARKGQTTTTQYETSKSDSKTHLPPSSVKPKPVRESAKDQKPADQQPSKGLGAVENEVIQSTPPTDSLVDLFDETGHDQDKDHGDLDPRDELTPG